MRFLENGTVEIKNKRTGETKTVTLNDLPNYGISYEKYAGEYNAYKSTIKEGKFDNKATQEALSTMQSNIQEAVTANPQADPRSLTWQWIHANEPFLKPRKINAHDLWSVYNAFPQQPQATPTPQPNFIQKLLNIGK